MNDRKTICFAIDANVSGGAERVITSLANYFAMKGYRVTLINSDIDSHFYPLHESVRVEKMGIDFSDCSIVSRLSRVVRKYKFLVNFFKNNPTQAFLVFLINMEIPGIVAGLRCGVKTYTSLRNSLSHFSKEQIAFMRFFYPRIAGLIFQNKAYLDNCIFRNVKKKAVIYNPLSLADEYDDTLIPCKKRKNWLISVGRLSLQKNQRFLIKAFSEIVDEFPEYELHLFGKGELKEELEEYIEALNLQEKVFLEGEMLNALYYHRDSKMFILSSLYEGFPNALVEAMAYGIPSISVDFDTGVAREIITDGENGFLFESNNLDQLKEKMKDILTLSADDYDSVALRSKEVINCLGIDEIGKQWENFIFKE